MQSRGDVGGCGSVGMGGRLWVWEVEVSVGVGGGESVNVGGGGESVGERWVRVWHVEVRVWVWEVGERVCECRGWR